jgi:hypothetical protein
MAATRHGGCTGSALKEPVINFLQGKAVEATKQPVIMRKAEKCVDTCYPFKFSSILINHSSFNTIMCFISGIR